MTSALLWESGSSGQISRSAFVDVCMCQLQSVGSALTGSSHTPCEPRLTDRLC
jgi:hypothetical protein